MITACFALAVCWSSMVYADDQARLLRFPTIHGDQVVFTYAGDLYTVSARGSVARKLTSDIGFEMLARFSPDGRWLGFTGEYDGSTEIYVMPAEGGVPRRITFTGSLEHDDISDRMGPNNLVMTWRDDKTVIVRTRANSWGHFIGELYAVPIDGGMPEQLPLPRGGWCSYSPDKKQLVYNRVFREFRTWKRYRGGQADDLWIYDFEKKTTTNITNDPACDIFPMWHGDTIYFLSDRDANKRMNLFAYDTKTKAVRQITHYEDFDVKFPSLGDTSIVYENGGFLYRYAMATNRVEQIHVVLHEDLVGGRGGLREVGREVTDYDVSPDGNRAVFVARGDVFTVPARNGNTRNLTHSSGVHERNAAWSPDGRWIAYISDASGEDEIYVMPQDGSGRATQLTRDGDTYRYHLAWSPDSKRILWGDKKQRLQFVEVQSKAVKLVAQATAWEIIDYHWSPDSQWIAYTKPEEQQMPRIHLYSLAAGKSWPATDGWFAAGSPTFSADGKYLFFVSDRTFQPSYGRVEENYTYFDMERIYFVTLAKDTKSPLAPRSDEVQVAKSLSPSSSRPPAALGIAPDEEQLPTASPSRPEDERQPTVDFAAAPKKETVARSESAAARAIDALRNRLFAAVRQPGAVKVDVDGLTSRIGVLPIAPSNYHHLTSVGARLFYLRHGLHDARGRLMAFDLDKRHETELGDVTGYVIAAEGRKMLVHADRAYSIVDLPIARIEIAGRLDLSGMKVDLDRSAEWKQIYTECWRQMRDFVYAPNMQGVDWRKIRERYAQLLPYVNHRVDLTYVIGEMIAELNLGHTYVGGGDYPRPRRIDVGLLGAKIERDAASGNFRIARILRGENWDPHFRSPLTEIGVNVKEGEYIVAVDGRPAKEIKNLFAALVDTAGRQVMLRVNAQPKMEGSRETVVIPVADERPLYYLDWVDRNIERVTKATDGKVAYVHIPNMGADGLNEFVKRFYPQLNKQALIVDVRSNGGGNVSPQIVERLRREMAMITVARNAAARVDPTGTILGPKVMLLDEFSASDGDIVAYRFKKYKLGPVIGKRSWGGVVGIRGSLPLLDGGMLSRPEFSRYDTEGKQWIIEGTGVEPDIVVDNDPAREFAGIDDQLERGIEVIKKLLAEHPVHLPPPPPFPDKSK